jgi:hypothetical protein
VVELVDVVKGRRIGIANRSAITPCTVTWMAVAATFGVRSTPPVARAEIALMML